jgi:hypothetical protein
MVYDVYLDIDGVLLANETHLANYTEEFLEFVVNRYPTYWLTTHSFDGQTDWPQKYVGRLCKPETVELLKRIKPSKSWKEAKTEAINFDRPFIWFDDDCFPKEERALQSNNVFDNWIKVDLSKNENQLLDFINNFPKPKNL